MTLQRNGSEMLHRRTNFYYDSASDLFVQFPKRKAVGIAKFIFDQPARPKGSKVKWEKREKREVNINGEIVKRTRGVLPPVARAAATTSGCVLRYA